MGHSLADPGDPATFAACKLDHTERERNATSVRLHRDLIRLRREDPVFRAQRSDGMHGAVLGPEAFLLRWFGGSEGDRLLLVNLGRDLMQMPSPEPLLAAPAGSEWCVAWSSEDPRYGGIGISPPERRQVTTPMKQARRYEEHTAAFWRVAGHAAVVLASAPLPKGEDERTGSS
jgi:maltooligosyltrehalose trehalohydrolase